MNSRRLLSTLALALAGALCLATGSASAAPTKQKFEVTFEGYWGANVYIREADEEPHHICIAGYGANSESEFEAWTRNKRKVTATLYADERRGVAFGSVPVETALERRFQLGTPPPTDCLPEYESASSRLDCDSGSPQWGRFGNPPAHLRLASGRGGVAIEVDREQESELAEHVWDFCPFWGNYEGDIKGEARVSAKRIFSGKPVTVRGTARQDVDGGAGTHEQEGYLEWKMTIRRVKPRR